MSKCSAVIELLDNFSGLATVCCKPGYEGYGEMRKKEQESLDVLLYSAYLAYNEYGFDIVIYDGGMVLPNEIRDDDIIAIKVPMYSSC